MKTATATTDRLIARWTEVIGNAESLERTAQGANLARGMRRYAAELAAEITARGYRLQPRCFSLNQPMLTTREAAARLGISPRRVIALIEAHRLPAEKIGRDWLIRERDLGRVADRRPGRPTKAAH